jgi:hypothetical protein
MYSNSGSHRIPRSNQEKITIFDNTLMMGEKIYPQEEVHHHDHYIVKNYVLKYPHDHEREMIVIIT